MCTKHKYNLEKNMHYDEFRENTTKQYGKSLTEQYEADFTKLEELAMAHVAKLKEDTPDPLADVLEGLDGEDRTKMKELTFEARYGNDTRTLTGRRKTKPTIQRVPNV